MKQNKVLHVQEACDPTNCSLVVKEYGKRKKKIKIVPLEPCLRCSR
jgi:hypothetical protein